VYKVIDSTNLEAFRLLEDGRRDRCVIVLSKIQTAGRGTHGRFWEDNHGQLSLTIGFKERLPSSQLGSLRVEFNRYCCERLNQLFDRELTVKSPNDILWRGKKLSGMLLESKLTGEWTDSWVVGFGMNLYSLHKEYWSQEVQDSAVVLQDILGGQMVNINTLAAEIIDALFAAKAAYFASSR
jgi:BirA family biotin operon repressor/biotin-[acetyl-CoA-carboxylase] ligase